MAPSPFLGNNDEVFKLADGSLWKVQFEYEYLYEFFPDVVICPSTGKLIIADKSLDIVPIQTVPSSRVSRARPSDAVTVIFRPKGCDYFVADGPRGLYIMEWYGGHDPDEGESFVGYTSGYGRKEVIYLESGSEGKVWTDDYLLSRSSAAEKIAEKCH